MLPPISQSLTESNQKVSAFLKRSMDRLTTGGIILLNDGKAFLFVKFDVLSLFSFLFNFMLSSPPH
jgi:hypothetical protein